MQVAQAARLLHLTELMTLCASAGVGSEGSWAPDVGLSMSDHDAPFADLL